MEQGQDAAPALAPGTDHPLGTVSGIRRGTRRGPGPSFLWRQGDAPLGLYVHVPFCRAMCSYCTFAKGLYDAVAADGWLSSLAREIEAREAGTWEGRPVLATLFLGGGTPSSLTPAQWQRLGETLRRGFERAPDCEFTAEANPESFVPETAAAMRGAGVNRVSFGAQSFDPEELRLLNRIHDAEAVEKAIEIARRAGFTNVSLDLMYGLPGQTPDRFARNLEAALSLGPEHLSAYCLSLEPGTRLTDEVASGDRPRPDGDRAADMYEHLVDCTAEAGYEAYEISNFARPGQESRHNLRYWRRDDVIALGPSAHALLANHRWANPAPLEAWARAYQGPEAMPEPKPVSLKDARFEWIFLRLRLREGFSRQAFEAQWGESFEHRYGVLARRLIEAGLLEEVEERVRLTSGARFLSDGVFAEFAP
jgi:putative oxygen-independent coproporphyrinogen III oxidase